MHIKCENTDVQTLHNRELMPKGYEVNFSENGVAQVKSDIGEKLIAEYDEISEHTED